ncbi:MAG: NupC/NupG family nucleoside CNT transporter [Fidelibacterota bacterium]
MKLISLLGMFILLFIAWLMSYERKKIQIRTVVWGMGLQLLFAVIILQKGLFSFMGMGVLALLIVLYQFKDDLVIPEKRTQAILKGLGWTLIPGIAWFFVYKIAHGALVLILLLLGIILFQKLKNRSFSQTLSRLFTVALFTLPISRGYDGELIFQSFSDKVAEFLNMSNYGAAFLFGNLIESQYFFPAVDTWPGFGYQFAFKVLPTIVFFAGFMSILYHLGVMQKVIVAMARFMQWTMGTSGAETLSCSANIFVGQTEAPLLIKPFIKDMTNSELLTIMVGGFATIAGGVLAGYIAMGVNAGHLIAASVMSAPAALVMGKIIFPETQESKTAGTVEMPEMPRNANVIDAAASGITDGLKLAVNVGAMLLGFIALIAVIDVFLNWLDMLIDGKLLGGAIYEYTAKTVSSPITKEYAGIFPGSLKTLFGNLLRPLAFVMGVPWNEAHLVGNLLGIKLSLNEFVAYGNLGTYIHTNVLGERAQIISTYALCGFANFSSIAIQLGGISALAPSRRADLSRVALKAMFGGALASWTTATLAGILI